MKQNHRFFNNTECEYFPCHTTKKPDDFNCLFCFCPLYFFEECGGKYAILESGVKDCSNCLIPHVPQGYDTIVGKIKDRLTEVKAKTTEAKLKEVK